MLKLSLSQLEALDLSRFRDMDYYAVEEYGLPIELMMENAGLQLANLIAQHTPDCSASIQIGVGNGNNGGGGLVAARRLAAWGYPVFLDIPVKIDKELPLKQLTRAKKFGVQEKLIANPAIWVDSYLGFSQRLPLIEAILTRIITANTIPDCTRISLDLPTGFLGDTHCTYFKADQVVTLAALKKVLLALPTQVELFVADLGIPRAVYEKFDIEIPPFHRSNVIQLTR